MDQAERLSSSVVTLNNKLQSALPINASGRRFLADANATQMRAIEEDSAINSILEARTRMFWLIYTRVRNVADAEDLTQDAVIKAIERRGQLRDSAKLAHWLSKVAINTAMDFLRRKASFKTENVPRHATSSDAVDVETSLIARIRDSELQACLAVLTVRELAALTLRDLDMLSASEVATHMKCSIGTVRSHIAHARKKLAPLLLERGYPKKQARAPQ
jgi:RNA polymerase sigma-70 factor (ECF subfamily)